MKTQVAAILLACLVVGCGGGKPFTGDLMTVVIGNGEKGDEPQAAVSAIESLKVGDETLFGPLACDQRGDGKWILKQTLTMSREVSNDTKATLTLTGPGGTESIPIVFSNSLIPKKAKHKIGDQTVVIQCYASVGNKWGLVIRPLAE